ncbi:MAG: hypothetical protein NTY87_09770 [Planctomycetia bacterium]|nr:hypothetical protein [Planctomycetia bacterium]
MSDELCWWFPVAAWGIVLAALARVTRLEQLLGWAGLPVAVGALSLVPINGLPLGRWLHGFSLNLSIPCLALLLDYSLSPLLSQPLLDKRGRRTGIFCGLLAGFLLYPLALGLGPFDPYVLGWSSPGVAAVAAGIGFVLLLQTNRFGFVLLAAGGAWQMRCLESTNAWDYLVDPVYCLLCLGNFSGQAMTAFTQFIKTSRPQQSQIVALAVVGATLLTHSLTAAATPPAAEPQHTATDDVATWSVTAANLAQRATLGGHAELALSIQQWQLPAESQQQFALLIPARLETPDSIDTPEEQTLWDDFCLARHSRAASTFALARTKSGAEKLRLVYQTLRDDPQHADARAIGGWVQRHGAWVWPEAARRIDKGEEYSADFGWLAKGRLDRYRKGERYEDGRWTTVAAQAARPRSIARGRKFASDHWQIVTTAELAQATLLAQRLEETHSIWRQAFAGFLPETPTAEKPAAISRRLVAHDPFDAKLLADRQQYVAELEKVEPLIGQTLGIYWSPTRTAWFFAEPAPQAVDTITPTTIHHEATHQLFAEMQKTSPLAGERCGFWAIEAAACYMESLTRTDFGWTLGGLEAGRTPAARERLLRDNFYLPLAELAAMGRRDFQASQRLPQLYSQISGLADFFMNGQQARYREAFLEYLVQIYTGTVEADTLAKLCRQTYANLDTDYRRHLSR